MKAHQLWSTCGILVATVALASCTQGQIDQFLQNTTQGVISGPCPPGSGPVSAAPEFCLYVTELRVVNHDTETDVGVTIVNRTGRTLYLYLQGRPYLTDSSGTKWDMTKSNGIAHMASVTPLPLEPNVDSQISFLFRRKGQAPADLTFSMRGEVSIRKVDSRGEPIPNSRPQAVRGFNFSGIRPVQQQPAAAPLQGFFDGK